MSSSDANGGLPVSKEKIVEKVDFLLNRDGIDNLKSSAVRALLRESFNLDFSAYKKEIDAIIHDHVTAFLKKQEDQKAKVEVKEEDKSPTTSKAEPNSDSDTDSDTGIASSGRKRPSRRQKPKSETTNDDLMSTVKNRRRAATKTTEKRPRTKKATTATPAKRKNGFGRYCFITDQLMAVTGRRYMARHQVVKAVWDYVKEHDLKDPKDKRFAICDDSLKPIFKVKRFRIFNMLQKIAFHMIDPKEVGPEAVEEAVQAEQASIAAVDEVNMSEGEEDEDTEKAE